MFWSFQFLLHFADIFFGLEFQICYVYIYAGLVYFSKVVTLFLFLAFFLIIMFKSILQLPDNTIWFITSFYFRIL